MSALHWFEIPVTNIERAKAFYETVLDVEISIVDVTEQMGSILGMIPDRGNPPAGALVQNSHHGYTPSQTGTLVYLTVGDIDLQLAVDKVDDAGGQVVLPKTSLGDNGFCAWVIDTEGNKVGLYSMK
ncbi:MAG: VOC family protein [Chloroflexota bacterium]